MAVSHATPQDFPLPADLEGFWTWDKMHCPRPLTPLTEEFVVQAASAGFSKASATVRLWHASTASPVWSKPSWGQPSSRMAYS